MIGLRVAQMARDEGFGRALDESLKADIEAFV